jgi:hypothetical protein
VEDFSKSTIHYWMFLDGGFDVGEGVKKNERKGKVRREGRRGEGSLGG